MRRFAAAASVALALLASGCHQYGFSMVPAQTPLYVNTGQPHYAARKSREQGEKELVLLARGLKDVLEEQFVFDSRMGIWYEIGYKEGPDTKGNNSVRYSTDVLEMFGPGDELVFYHIHPASSCPKDVINSMRKTGRGILSKAVEVKAMKMARGAEVPAKLEKMIADMEWALSSEANECRWMLMPFLTLPSYSDLVSARNTRVRASGMGMGCRDAIASPYGVTDIEVDGERLPKNDWFGSKAGSMSGRFELEACKSDPVRFAKDPGGEMGRMDDATGGAFRVSFRPAESMGLPPYEPRWDEDVEPAADCGLLEK